MNLYLKGYWHLIFKMSQVKKKRGRKPKNNIVINENPVFDNDAHDNLISCVKCKDDIIISDEGKCISGIDGISGLDIDDNVSLLDATDTCQKKCWNCCHDIESDIISYPIAYLNGAFYTNGNFCSYECSARYIFDNFNHKEVWEKYNLLNLYYNMNTNQNKSVKVPPNRLRLQMFGGTLSRFEYINTLSTISYDGYMPPIIPVNNLFYDNDPHPVSTDNEYKLFRKNKTHKNNIQGKLENLIPGQ